MTATKLFTGGIPYGPDVKRIVEALPVPSLTEGTVITHEQLEEILGYKRGTSRYYGVINSWIGRQKNENSIFMRWEAATGIKVLDPAGLLNHGETKTRQKATQILRALNIFAWVDRNRLDANGQRRLDHQILVATKLRDAATSAKKELAVEIAPIKSLPKRQLPEAQRAS